MGDERKLRVLHIVPTLAMGGAPRGVVELVERQQAMAGIDSRLCVLGSQADAFYGRHLSPAPIFLDYLFHLKDVVGTWRACEEVARAARDMRADIIHTHLMPADFLGALVAKRLRLPHLAHIRSTPPALNSNSWRGYRLRWLYRKAFKAAGTRFVSVSQAAADYVGSALRIDPALIEVVPNGVDERLFQPDGPAMARPDHRWVIGTAGRFAPEKGHEYLIAATAELVRQGHDVYLRMIGAGSLRSTYLDQAKALGIGDRLELLEPVKDTAPFYRSLDIFVLPSKDSEGMPRVALEAMLCGKAVVATRVAGTVEAVVDGRTGILVEPGVACSLARAIERTLVDCDLRDRLSENARQHAGVHFSATRVNSAVCDRYYGLQ